MILTQFLNRAAAKRQRGFFWLLIFFMDHIRQVMIKTFVVDIVFLLVNLSSTVFLKLY